MATQPSNPDSITEACPHCDGETHHDVRVEIRTESEKEKNAEFSREPYRVVTCHECGTESAMRMNNA
ncbi:DUF7835 family putative zinc beta-ribbon protein [Candidatus Halobonum tyrrellensis]|uniref:DUF7835 domain-containing protein n=1 Tax=Candidatus Halobonum tyrrellensis G22 TaxID=1324957 RepID=V4GRZ4_9EURY|nr:hypothetical protein [Candidatus Halobonum tyrrellensis]ESP87816.1 hypothetical protein K933_12111 [Candidatus Halobonum tyrrellensis G22]